MEAKRNLEILQEAVNQLPEEEDIKADKLSSTDNFLTVDEEENEEAGGLRHHHNQQRLLSQPLSQLESLEEDKFDPEESKQQDNGKETMPSSSEIDKKISTRGRDNEEIIKELKNIKRQNLITHCLLSAMIVVTLTWQLSEVSLILKIKNVLCNPLKSLGGIVRRVLKGNSKVSVQEVMKQAAAKQNQVIEPQTSIPGIKIPELPQLELPRLDISDKDLRD